MLAMSLFRFEYTAITKIMLNRATLVKFYFNYSLSFAGTLNLALAPFMESSMIPVLRKVAQLNIKYRKNGSLIIDVCFGDSPDEVMALVHLN